jgi:hypothetical protein
MQVYIGELSHPTTRSGLQRVGARPAARPGPSRPRLPTDVAIARLGRGGEA